MVITDAQGRERRRQFSLLRYDLQDGGDQDFYVYFKEPADVRKMVYLVHKHPGKGDDRWLYLRRPPGADLGDRRPALYGYDGYWKTGDNSLVRNSEWRLLASLKIIPMLFWPSGLVSEFVLYVTGRKYATFS